MPVTVHDVEQELQDDLERLAWKKRKSQRVSDVAWVPKVCTGMLLCGVGCGVLMLCLSQLLSSRENQATQLPQLQSSPKDFETVGAPEHIRALAIKHLGENQATQFFATAKRSSRNYKGKVLTFWHNEEDLLDFAYNDNYQFHKLANLTVPKSVCQHSLSTTNGRCGPGFGRCNGKRHARREALFCGDSWCGNASDPHRWLQVTDIFDFRPTSCSLVSIHKLESGDEVIANKNHASMGDISPRTTGMVVHVDTNGAAFVKWNGIDKIQPLPPSDFDAVKIKWKGAFVVDVGANLGDTAIIAHLENKRLQILSFEPSPYNYIFLRWNLFSNQIPELTYQGFNARQYGVLALLGGASKDGRPIDLAFAPEQSKHAQAKSDFAALGFQVPPHAGGSHELTSREAKKYSGTWTQITVPSFALPTWLVQHNSPTIKWFKMDCEGCEYETLIDLVNGGFLNESIVVGEAHYRHVADLSCAKEPGKAGCKDMISTMLTVRSIMCGKEYYRFAGCDKLKPCDVFQRRCMPNETPPHVESESAAPAYLIYHLYSLMLVELAILLY